MSSSALLLECLVTSQFYMFQGIILGMIGGFCLGKLNLEKHLSP
jgi:hypothetical protein